MKFTNSFRRLFCTVGLTLMAVLACRTADQGAVSVDGEQITILFDNNLHSRLIARFGDRRIPLGEYSPSEYITVSGEEWKDFPLSEERRESIENSLGTGTRVFVIGDNGSVRKEISVVVYRDFPFMALFQVTYTNTGSSELNIDSWTSHGYAVSSGASGKGEPAFWSFQSGSYESRPDWVLPLSSGFKQENYMGMNATDYGGGTPVSDVWRRDVGVGIGLVEKTPKLVSLPVEMPGSKEALIGIHFPVNQVLAPGMSIRTFETFVAVHEGDFFQTLSAYRRLMEKRGIQFDKTPETAYEPIWCAWGFRRDFTMDQIMGALPKVKELGFEWAVLDDGWQTAEGDWYLVESKFPRGDRDMKGLVEKIHDYGLKAKLWWAPLAVDPGTDLIEDHSDYLLLNRKGMKQEISWWDAYYLCPAYPPVKEYTRELVVKIMKDWDFDGLKIDGQHLNASPPCTNPAHGHPRPEESVEAMPEFFKLIYETARSIKPDAVVEICPCGTAYSFHTMPYMNQPVASDPESSWQIRLKGKTFKALMGPSTAYYGDHVELSDGGEDFASTVGIGGVIGTKFTWPVGSEKDSRVDLTPEREVIWKEWLRIYEENMLPTGTYMGNLYDIGFDRPEAHAIHKSGRMYYAFYADTFSGTVELRGLGEGQYTVRDYVNQVDFGSISGPSARLDVEFNKYLLLEAASIPTESH
jgi:alpha-galactosidase